MSEIYYRKRVMERDDDEMNQVLNQNNNSKAHAITRNLKRNQSTLHCCNGNASTKKMNN